MAKFCKHCEQPIPSNMAGDFCCSGCSAAYAILNNMGLQNYYQKRQLSANARALTPTENTLTDLTPYIKTTGGISTLHLIVDGLHCAACVWLIETVLAKQTGVIKARLNMTTRRLTLQWHTTKTDATTLLNSVYALGYRLLPYHPELLEQSSRAHEKHLLLCLGVAGFAAANVMLLSVALWAGGEFEPATRALLQWFSALIVLPAVAWAGRPFFSSAATALSYRRLNMDVPISLALLITLAISFYDMWVGVGDTYFESAIMLLFFLLIGRYLDFKVRSKSKSAAEQLLTIQASVATIIKDGKTQTIALEQLQVGDILLVAKGERIAADGVIINGTSTLDNSLLTGESLPQTISIGAAVQAGCINLTDPIQIRVTAVAEQTALAQIIKLVEQATANKSCYTRLADKVVRLYSPVVHLLAAATFAGWITAGVGAHQAAIYATAVLIVTCPCALALAVPTVQVAIVSRLLKMGVLLNSATALERLQSITTIVFDKTGTLTTGKFKLVSGGTKGKRALAAQLAVNSSHPLAKAIAATTVNPKPLNGVSEHAGQGLSTATLKLGSATFCKIDPKLITPLNAGETDLWFCEQGQKPVRFILQDQLRADATATIKACRKLGLKLQILSGDQSTTVANIANELKIKNWQAAASPAAKHATLQQLQQAGEQVLMCGDGINDAPSLAAANVGLTLGSAADIARTQADIILQNDRLADVITTYKLARLSQRAIKGNIGFAFCYNAVAVPLAMAGFVTPLWAALLMSGSSLTVVLNAARLNKVKI